MSLSTLVTTARKKKGMTQEDLADKSNVTVRTIQRIESGESQPRMYTIKLLAKALDLPYEEMQPLLPEHNPEIQVPNDAEKNKDIGTGKHFLQLLILSCFSFIVIPYVHFLIPMRMRRKAGELSAQATGFAKKIIVQQATWVVGLHVSLLLTLAYNIIQSRQANKEYLIGYLPVVAVFYSINAAFLTWKFLQVNKIT